VTTLIHSHTTGDGHTSRPFLYALIL
jgi:hypothetical protein